MMVGQWCLHRDRLTFLHCLLFVIYANYEQSHFGEDGFPWQNRI
jgi:hypothetical protein